MKLYRFSPIQDEKQLRKAVTYIVKQLTMLSKKVVGKKLPIQSVTIFAHYSEEYEKLTKVLFRIGKFHTENNGPRVTLKIPIKVGSHKILQLRIRKPDSHRLQVGCADFQVKNYSEFKKKFLTKNHNLRLIERTEYEMIEFFDPNFDVLGYVVSG